MSLRIAVLTTQTPHHAYFVRELMKCYSNISVFCETANTASQPFETHHPFEDERDAYEWNKWFAGNQTDMEDIAYTQKFSSLNNPEAVTALKRSSADVLIVFGTGLIKPQVIEFNPKRIFNLHGGDPERYRGLDTHLWAIYHNDFSALVTTLHRLDPGLDTGDIVLQGALPIQEGMPFNALRAVNTELCLKLAVSTIDMFVRYGDVVSKPQRCKGRYYSAMPKDLKSICIQKFEKFIRDKNNEA